MSNPLHTKKIKHKLIGSYEKSAAELYGTIASIMPRSAEGYSPDDLKQILDIVSGGLDAVRVLLAATTASIDYPDITETGITGKELKAQVDIKKVEEQKPRNEKSLLRRQWLVDNFRDRCDEWVSVSEILSVDTTGEVFGMGEGKYEALHAALKFTGFKHNNLKARASRYMLTADVLALLSESDGVLEDGFNKEEGSTANEEDVDFLDLAATLN